MTRDTDEGDPTLFDDLRAVMRSRLNNSILLAILLAFDAFEHRRNMAAAAALLALGLAWIGSALLAHSWPHPLFLLADGVFFVVGAGYFLILNLAGMNYWSAHFPLDWVLVGGCGLIGFFRIRAYRHIADIPGDPRGARTALLWCLAGPCFVAADWFQPDTFNQHLRKGTTYAKKGEFAPAIAEFSQAIDARPDRHEAYYNRALARRSNGETAGAIEDCTAALERRPRLPEAYLLRGDCRHKSGDLIGAVADFTQVIELDPARAEAYAMRGQVLLQLGRKDEAQQDFQQCLKLKPALKEPSDN
jgi:tetratricopeptide (TPR) repeat protein